MFGTAVTRYPVCLKVIVYNLLPYSGLILRGENFKIFVDFALSSKYVNHEKFSAILLKKL